MNFLVRCAPALLAGALLLSPLTLHAWLEEVSPQMNEVLLQRCTSCHDLERVGLALEQGRSLSEIQKAMLERGAILSDQDKQILGTFWGPPARNLDLQTQQPVASAITAQQAAAFNTVIEQRCVFCHSRERIDDAIARRLPFEPLEEIMLKRGATLTPQEQQTLKIFWEAPHRQ